MNATRFGLTAVMALIVTQVPAGQSRYHYGFRMVGYLAGVSPGRVRKLLSSADAKLLLLSVLPPPLNGQRPMHTVATQVDAKTGHLWRGREALKRLATAHHLNVVLSNWPILRTPGTYGVAPNKPRGFQRVA